MARVGGDLFSGDPGRNRTCDIRLRRPVFCPLNYGTKAGVEGIEPTMRDSKSRALPLGDTPKKEPAPTSTTWSSGEGLGLEIGAGLTGRGRDAGHNIGATLIILPCPLIATPKTGPLDTISSLP